MNESSVKRYTDFILPFSIVSKADVARLVSEFEQVDNELTTMSVRAKTVAQPYSQPVLSRQLTDFLNQNKIVLHNAQERNDLLHQLYLLKDNVSIIHLTFAVPADPQSLRYLAQWLRASIHPQAIISVGLQPSLVAGVYVRTPNHVHDLSVRARLAQQHGLLVKELGALRGTS